MYSKCRIKTYLLTYRNRKKKNVEDAEETNKPEETYKPITDINFTEEDIIK